MKCPYCEIEGVISGVKTQVEGDSSPETQTQVFTVQDITCRNPQCSHFEQKVAEVKHQIF